MRKLTKEHVCTAFIAATCTTLDAKIRWKKRSETGLNDAGLKKALRYELGIFGGASKRENRPFITFQGSGLKIWISWQAINHCQEKPIFECAATMNMARETFGIDDPDNDQMLLF
jgi:hypothetical protein